MSTNENDDPHDEKIAKDRYAALTRMKFTEAFIFETLRLHPSVPHLARTAKKDINEVQSAFNTFSMKAKLSKSQRLFRAAGATGVPSIIIDGRYITSSTMAGGEKNTIELINYIVGNIRKDKAKN